MKHFSGGGAWNLIPFVGGVKAQDEADEYVAKQQGKNKRQLKSRQRQKVYWQRHLLTKRAQF